jgi:hypothetical protein
VSLSPPHPHLCPGHDVSKLRWVSMWVNNTPARFVLPARPAPPDPDSPPACLPPASPALSANASPLATDHVQWPHRLTSRISPPFCFVMQDRLPQPDPPFLEQIRIRCLPGGHAAHHPIHQPTVFPQQTLHIPCTSRLGTPKSLYPPCPAFQYNRQCDISFLDMDSLISSSDSEMSLSILELLSYFF